MISIIKKGLIYLLLTILVFSSIPSNAHSVSQETTSKINVISPQSEQVRWYYRDILGGKQKRLWSRTYGHWITDWIWI